LGFGISFSSLLQTAQNFPFGQADAAQEMIREICPAAIPQRVQRQDKNVPVRYWIADGCGIGNAPPGNNSFPRGQLRF